MVGKNFSANNLGQRKASDFYETPYSITEKLLQNEEFDRVRHVCEPACGNGAIFTVLDERGFERITSYDVEVDFLKECRTFDYIITNPPFSLAQQFILQCKRVALIKFALLLPLSYLHGKKRFDLIYSDRAYPLARVYVFTRYPMLGDELRDDGKYRTGMMVYAWYVWERAHTGEPVIRWIDNNSDVIGSGD